MADDGYRFERPFETLEILHLSQGSHVDRLRELLLPEPLHQASPAAHALLDTILRSGLCQTVVVENAYVDRDYGRAYRSFYSRAYPDYGRYSTRLHFFGSTLTRRSLANLETRRLRRAYLGYCVVRPLRARKIGRTVLWPLLADPDADFALTLSQFEANLAGARLAVHGAPFQEQDTRVARCASCAIWMSTMMAGQLFGLPVSTTAEITELALGYPLGEQVLGSTGLKVEEMENGLRGMGYNPLILRIADRESAIRAIHPYVEGGIAPILLMLNERGRHAVVTVGHGYDTSSKVGGTAQTYWEGKPISFWRSSQWINYFLVHDDQCGPFRRMRFLSASETGGQGGCWVEIDMTFPSFTDNAGWPSTITALLYAAIIPVPPNISMNGLEAEEKAARLMQIIFENVYNISMPDNIVLRTYLVRSNDFKRFAYGRNLPSRIRNLYRGKAMPRWVWVTELCTEDDAVVADKRDRVVRGEIVLDGNGSLTAPDFLVAHVISAGRGYIALMKPEDASAASAIEGGLIYDHARPWKALVR